MSVVFLSWGVLLVVCLLAYLITALVLMAFQRTRVVGVAMLPILAVMVGLGVLAAYVSVRQVSHEEHFHEQAWAKHEQAWEQHRQSTEPRFDHVVEAPVEVEEYPPLIEAETRAIPEQLPRADERSSASVSPAETMMAPVEPSPRPKGVKGKRRPDSKSDTSKQPAAAGRQGSDEVRPMPVEAEAAAVESDAAVTAAPSAEESVASPDAPDWVAEETGDSPRRQKITVGPFPTRAECQDELATPLQRALSRYAVHYFGDVGAFGDAGMPPFHWSDKDLRRMLVKEQWFEEVETSFGKWVKLHALVEFDHDAVSRLREEHRAAVAHGRLWVVGLAAAGLLGLVGVAFAGLKADIATRGQRRGAVVGGGAATLVLIALLGALAMRLL